MSELATQRKSAGMNKKENVANNIQTVQTDTMKRCCVCALCTVHVIPMSVCIALSSESAKTKPYKC